MTPADSPTPTWDLTDLFSGPDDPALADILDHAQFRAVAFATRWRDRIATASPADLLKALQEYEELVGPMRRAATYANLRVATDGDDSQRQALANRIGQISAEAQAETLFLELALLALPDEDFAALHADPMWASHRHYLTRLAVQRPHVLAEPQEQVLTRLGPTGPAAWQRLFHNLTSNLQVPTPGGGSVPLEVGLAGIRESDRAARNGATEAVSRALMPGLEVRAAIFDTLVQDKAIRDDIRGYPTWATTRHMDNEVTQAQVDALVGAVSSRYDLVERWYRLKGRLCGITDMGEHDRYAPLNLTGVAPTPSHSWDDARRLVTAAYGDLSPVASEIVARHFEERWIDAVPGTSKQPGAFCAAVPGHHPFVNLSFTGTDGDVMTVAHELGHGIHGWLQRDVPPSVFDVPLTMAETASVFGETVTFRRLAAASPDDSTTLSLLSSRIESEIATIFRQVAMYEFEDAVHTRRRRDGQLGVADLNELWMSTQQRMFGSALTLGERYAHWWSYIPHFIGSPGYVYAYAFGNLLSFALLERWEAEGEAFVDTYLGMLARGGSAPPAELLAPLGVNLDDPGFWSDGIGVLESLIGDAERLAESVLGSH